MKALHAGRLFDGTGLWRARVVLFDGARGPRYALGNVTLLDSNSANVVPLSDVRHVIVPEIYDNTTLKNVLRVKTIPPPPLPPGGVGRATLGTRKLEYLRVQRERLGDKANSAAVQKDKDQNTLSIDPDELASELSALAGPSVGPNGGQYYFEDASLPQRIYISKNSKNTCTHNCSALSIFRLFWH